jgi:hypothetical protein
MSHLTIHIDDPTQIAVDRLRSQIIIRYWGFGFLGVVIGIYGYQVVRGFPDTLVDRTFTITGAICLAGWLGIRWWINKKWWESYENATRFLSTDEAAELSEKWHKESEKLRHLLN